MKRFKRSTHLRSFDGMMALSTGLLGSLESFHFWIWKADEFTRSLREGSMLSRSSLSPSASSFCNGT